MTEQTNTPRKFAIKHVHKSKVYAVKIITRQEHHEIATIPNVYEILGEKSEGYKASVLFVNSPELFEVLKALVECPDYKGISTLEMKAARELIADIEEDLQ